VRRSTVSNSSLVKGKGSKEIASQRGTDEGKDGTTHSMNPC
jgi:hypothetical protein